MKQKYIDTGKVRWVALNLPLPFHKDAKQAAQAAHCAGEQDKFREMRELLFNNPKAGWGESSRACRNALAGREGVQRLPGERPAPG